MFDFFNSSSVIRSGCRGLMLDNRDRPLQFWSGFLFHERCGCYQTHIIPPTLGQKVYRISGFVYFIVLNAHLNSQTIPAQFGAVLPASVGNIVFQCAQLRQHFAQMEDLVRYITPTNVHIKHIRDCSPKHADSLYPLKTISFPVAPRSV